MSKLYDWSKDTDLIDPRNIIQLDRPSPVRENQRDLPALNTERPTPNVRPSRLNCPQETRGSRNPRSRQSRKKAVRRRHLRRRRQRNIFLLIATLSLLLIWTVANRTISAPIVQETSADQVMSDNAPTPSMADDISEIPQIFVPDWITQDILPINEYSRPGTKLDEVTGVVVHYTGNPGTTAEQNRSYFKNLAETKETYASSHFVIGIDGKIIQCVPLDEVAYCSNNRNNDTISIECCHTDDTGQFSQATLDALIQLLNWLIKTYELRQGDILRHYDVIGKECPYYFVKNPDAWEGLLNSLTYANAF